MLSPAQKEAQQQAYVQAEINKEYDKALNQIDQSIASVDSSIQNAKVNINNLNQSLQIERDPGARTGIVQSIRAFEREIGDLQNKRQVYVSARGMPKEQLISNLGVIEANAIARYEESYKGHYGPTTPTQQGGVVVSASVYQQLQQAGKLGEVNVKGIFDPNSGKTFASTNAYNQYITAKEKGTLIRETKLTKYPAQVQTGEKIQAKLKTSMERLLAPPDNVLTRALSKANKATLNQDELKLTPNTISSITTNKVDPYYQSVWGDKPLTFFGKFRKVISEGSLGQQYREITSYLSNQQRLSLQKAQEEVFIVPGVKKDYINPYDPYTSTKFGPRIIEAPTIYRRETLTYAPKDFAKLTPEAQYYSLVIKEELPATIKTETQLKNELDRIQKQVNNGILTVEQANEQLKINQQQLIDKHNEEAKLRDEKRIEQIFPTAKTIPQYLGFDKDLGKIEYKPYDEAKKLYESKLVQSMPEDKRGEFVRKEIAKRAAFVGAYEGIRSQPKKIGQVFLVASGVSAVTAATGGTFLAPAVAAGGVVLGTIYGGSVALRIGTTPGYFEKYGKAGEIVTTEIIPGFVGARIGSRVGYAGKEAVTSYQQLKGQTFDKGGKITEAQAFTSARKEFVNKIFSNKPSQTGIIPFKATASQQAKLVRISKGQTTEVSKDVIAILRDMKVPGRFEIRGIKTYFTPSTVRYQIGMFGDKGYQVRKLKIEGEASLQKVIIGKNLFKTESFGKQGKIITGSGLRKIETVSPNYYQSDKYLIGKRWTSTTEDQLFSGGGIATTAKETKSLLSNIIGKNKVIDKMIQPIKSEISPGAEAKLFGKKDTTGYASLFPKPTDISKGIGEFKFVGLRKVSITQAVKPTQFIKEGLPAVIRIDSLVRGRRATASGGGYGYITKVGIKDAKELVEGKQENIRTTIMGGEARSGIGTKSSKPTIISSRTIDVFKTKADAGGGSSGKGGSISSGGGGMDEGIGGGGQNIFGSMQKQQMKPMFQFEEPVYAASFSPVNLPSQRSFVIPKQTGFTSGIGFKSIGTSGLFNIKTQGKVQAKTSVQSLGVSQVQTPITTQVPLSTTGLTSTNVQTLTQAVVPVQTQTTVQTQVQVPILVQTPISGIGGTTFQFTPTKPTPSKPIIGGFLFPREAQQKEQQAYYPEVRIDATKNRKARWERVSEIPQTKESAISQVARVVDNTISAKGRVVPAPKKEVAQDTGDKYFEINRRKFRGFQQKKGIRYNSK